MLHLCLLWHRCLVFFDWVPSEDNSADWPTREDKAHLIPPEAMEVDLVIPAFEFF